ncbi:hypothetical protein FQN54_008305 [Arachnomyces sp. PD_36]|nr:hypothetical protein FQN54_008305 [Arachnomyces sp. PD_36]
MANLTVASKADHSLSLPVALATAYVAETDTGGKITTLFEDAASVGPRKEYLKLAMPDGSVVYDQAVLHYLRQEFPVLQVGNKDQVSEWISRAADLTACDFKSLEQPLLELDDHLTLRSFIVGHSFTLADIAVWGSVRGNKVLMSAIKKKSVNVSRWFSLVEQLNPWVNQTVLDLTAHARQKKRVDSAAGGSYDIGLDMEGIVTRFPPEPSGYLHIGHAKATLLNDYFAHKNPGGTLICRFDDTNPTKETSEFQDAILHDLELLGVRPDKISYSSDYFGIMYELCVKLISSGNAYADDTDKETMDHERREGIASKRRDMSPADSLARLKEMKSGSGSNWCIRAKISADDLNKAMRDPVIYRCNSQPHHLTGDT